LKEFVSKNIRDIIKDNILNNNGYEEICKRSENEYFTKIDNANLDLRTHNENELVHEPLNRWVEPLATLADRFVDRGTT
jgi:hypothetical protein